MAPTSHCTGFEASLCLDVSEHRKMPAPGNTISGTAYLIAAIDVPSWPRTW
jgi:hypothetical protein